MGIAYPSPSLADPSGSGAVVAAVLWLQGTLLGTAATSVAVICVAAVGMMMLSGRISVRRAASVIFGCFIVFGASSIVAGIQSLGGGGTTPAYPPQAFVPPAYAPSPATAPASGGADPFAGAAVPAR